MKNLFSKSPLILAFALLFILPIISFSQNVNSKSSIQVLEYSKIKFNSEEQRLYDLYASKDLYSSHILINSKVLPSLHRMGKLALKLPSLEMEVQSYTKSLEAEDENNYTWITEFIELGGEAILICEKGKLYGSISYFDKNYKVISIKEGVSMILLLDKEKLKDIETCRNDKKSNNTLISTPSNYYRDPCTVIDLLVMYTDNAATALGGVSAVIQEANTLVTTMNLAYSNSDMNGSINLVGVQNLDGINESVTALAVVTEFAIDGASAKDIANADLALLIYDSNAPDGIVGFAQGIGPPNSFSVVDEAFVNTTLVGVHEVGHLMGGEHERCNSIVSGPECDDTGTIEHAHIFKTGFWWWQRVTRSTIMRSGSNIGNPITHFSNPDIDFLNKATGQNNFRDNSRRFDENLCAVANIEQGISPPIASINGPSTGNNFTYSTWCASATDCGSPSYYWEYSNNGFSYSYGGSGSCYSSYLTLNTDLYLKVTVSCSSGLSDTEWRTIQYSGELKESITVINREGEAKNNHNLTPYGEIALFPNPSLGNVFVNFEKLNLDLTNTSLIATDIFGNMILSRKFSSQSTSDNQTKLYFETPGLYFITLISDSKRYISKVTIIK